jgi:hypothetical protein
VHFLVFFFEIHQIAVEPIDLICQIRNELTFLSKIFGNADQLTTQSILFRNQLRIRFLELFIRIFQPRIFRAQKFVVILRLFDPFCDTMNIFFHLP